MSRKAKRILSWLLTVAMVLGLMPLGVGGGTQRVKAAATNDGWTVTWDETDAATTVTDGLMYGNFKVVSPKSGGTAVDANKKSLNGQSFTHRFKFGGTGDTTKINLTFEAPAGGILTVYGITGSSSSTDRCLVLEGSNGYKETSAPFPNALTECKFEFSEGGTYSLYSTVGAINIYYLSYESGLQGTAPVIKDSSVEVQVPTGGAVSPSTVAKITWTIETAASGNAKIQVEYRINSGDWNTAAVLDADATSYDHDILEVESGELQYRITGLGATNSTPVLSDAVTWEQPRKAWTEVADPEVTAAQGTGSDKGKIIVSWTMDMGRNGADQITVILKDKNSTEIGTKVLTADDVKDASSGTVEFTPKSSGNYTVEVTAVRNEESTEKTANTAVNNFILPLALPTIQSVMCTGEGTAAVTWTEVPEAEEYEVSAKLEGADDSTYIALGKTTSVSLEVSGLTDGEKYTFKVQASRASTGDATEATMDKYMTGMEEKEFKSAPVGSGAKGTAVGDFYEKDGKVTINATGGKIGDSEDGFVFYYTELGADDNFVMEATFEVTDVNVGGTMSNQTGFGLIAIDTIAGAGNSNGRYFNSAAAALAKYKKMNAETGSSSTFDNLAGLRVVTGYTDFNATSSSSARYISNTDSAFEYPESNSATHSYTVGDTYHFKLRRSNTGYHGILVKDDGTEIEKIYYYPAGDDYTDPLLVQDEEHIYVGLMASRYIQVEVTDMSLTIVKPEDDDPRIQPPTSYTVPSINIYSTTTIGTSKYPFEYRANIAGHLVVTDAKGKELINRDIQANEYVEEIFTLTKGENTFTCTLTPAQTESLESYNPIERTLTVSYKSYGSASETIVVAPDGKATGTGSESKPLDIYTAFQYVQPGQTILLKNGTYKLTEGLTVKRGHDGTANGRITVVAETPGEVIIDLSNADSGFVISADYWHLYGLDICNAPFGAKVVHIQGNYNIVELCKMHDNGDSGLQISGSSLEPNTKWPSYNLIKNCDAYDNADYKGNDADGFAAKLTSGEGNVFEGCISHHNIDDGWDLYAKSTTGSIGDVIIRNCVTYANGYLSENARLKGQLLAEDQGEGNGFKLGGESMPGRHQLINSITFDNGAKGVTSNSGPDCIVQDVTSYGNGTFGKAENISLYTNTASYTNYEADGIISMAPVSGAADKRQLKDQDSLDSNTNYFYDGAASVNASGAEATEDWFVSVDVSVVPTRNADGSINMHGLFELTAEAPSDSGARLEAVISEYPEIPVFIKDAGVVEDSSDDDDDDSTGSSGNSGSHSNTTVITSNQTTAEADLGDTTGVWKKDDKGWWYQKEDGTYPAESWLKVQGDWYLFDDTGYMKTGWQKTSDKWYYLDDVNGDMKTGWIKTTDGKWYLLDTVNGDMKTGWQKTSDGKWYYLDLVNGDMKTGWIKTADGKWYYLYADGSCAMDTITPDGYRVDKNGAWVN